MERVDPFAGGFARSVKRRGILRAGERRDAAGAATGAAGTLGRPAVDRGHGAAVFIADRADRLIVGDDKSAHLDLA